MFNNAWFTSRFNPRKATGGPSTEDFVTHQTLYAGVDPADRNRILVRKLVKVSPTTYCYEEIRVTPSETGPIYHSQIFRLKGFDLHEHLAPEEIQIRGAMRPIPNVLGFSLYSKKLKMGPYHCSIVENALYKANQSSWLEWFQDIRDRRDMSSYLRHQWSLN